MAWAGRAEILRQLKDVGINGIGNRIGKAALRLRTDEGD
jgi:hypothetical protein